MNKHKLKAEYRQRIIEVLSESSIPLGVRHICRKASIANWETAFAHCLELLVEGRIRGFKTARGWVFAKKPERAVELHEAAN